MGRHKRRVRAVGVEGSRNRRSRAAGAAGTRRKRRLSGDEVAVCTACQPFAFQCSSRGVPKAQKSLAESLRVLQQEYNFALAGVECIVFPATKLDLHIRVPISAVMGKVLLASALLQ